MDTRQDEIGNIWYIVSRYRLPQGTDQEIQDANNNRIVLPPEEEDADRVAHPRLYEVCDLFDLCILCDVDEDKYALGKPESEGSVTPWFSNVDALECFCRANLASFRDGVSLN